MRKKILILGNGFDLAHGLPTKYSDFLTFSEWAMRIYTYSNQPDADKKYTDSLLTELTKKAPIPLAYVFLKEKLCDLFKCRVIEELPVSDNLFANAKSVKVNERLDYFHNYLIKNIWYEYIKTLFEKGKTIGENWIDFESEISFIIERLDDTSNSLKHFLNDVQQRYNDTEAEDDYKDKMNLFVRVCGQCCDGNEYNAIRTLTLDALRKRLYKDLENLTLAFEIYLTDFVCEIPIKITIPLIKKINPDFIISFNYTDTYEKYYMDDNARKENRICHIHGVCVRDRKPEDNNMVLGIDEYLSEELRNKSVDYCIFKKFVQRLRKHNDVSYASWAREIEKRGKDASSINQSLMDEDAVLAGESSNTENNTDIYIYGHSLDITDKDILQRFLISKYTHVHVFARNKMAEEKLIANLIRIMGEDTIIRKSTTNPQMIQLMLGEMEK